MTVLLKERENTCCGITNWVKKNIAINIHIVINSGLFKVSEIEGEGKYK